MEDAQPGGIPEYLKEICQKVQVIVADLAAKVYMMFMVDAADRGLCFDFMILCQSKYLSYCFPVFYFTRKGDNLQHKIYFILLGRLNCLDPFAAFQPEQAPEGLDELIHLQEEVDPEGRKTEH